MQRPTTVKDLYEQHAEFVWRTLRRLGVPSADVADATQDVFIAVHRTIASFESRSALSTWLYTICRRIARDRRQRAHLRHEVADEHALELRSDPRSDPSRGLEIADSVRALEAALDTLDDAQREVFILFELEELSAEEIATTISVPLGTVYSRLRLARAAFQQFLLRADARERFATPRRGIVT